MKEKLGTFVMNVVETHISTVRGGNVKNVGIHSMLTVEGERGMSEDRVIQNYTRINDNTHCPRCGETSPRFVSKDSQGRVYCLMCHHNIIK